MGRETGGRFRREGIYVYLWLIHVEVWQKTAKFCKAIILQLKKKKTYLCLLFSHSFLSDSLQPHGQQHARFPCLSLFWVCSNPCPLTWWCHPTVSSSVIPFSSCLQAFPASGSFPIRWLFTSGGQSVGTSASSISPSNEYSGLISLRIDWFDLLAVQGTIKSLLQHHSWKGSILHHSAFLMVQFSHPYMTTGKNRITKSCYFYSYFALFLPYVFNSTCCYWLNCDPHLTTFIEIAY